MRPVHSLSGLVLAALLLAGTSASCRAQYATVSDPGGVSTRKADDALVATAFRILLDEVIGDSANRVCVSVASPGEDLPRTADDAVDRDPSEAVLRRLRGGDVAVHARSVCAADERNFGPTRGLLRLRQVAVAADGTLTIDADAIADHFARYRCVAKRIDGRVADARCQILSRD